MFFISENENAFLHNAAKRNYPNNFDDFEWEFNWKFGPFQLEQKHKFMKFICHVYCFLSSIECDEWIRIDNMYLLVNIIMLWQ